MSLSSNFEDKSKRYLRNIIVKIGLENWHARRSNSKSTLEQ